MTPEALKQVREALRLSREWNEYWRAQNEPRLVRFTEMVITALLAAEQAKAPPDWNGTQRPDGTWAADDKALGREPHEMAMLPDWHKTYNDLDTWADEAEAAANRERLGRVVREAWIKWAQQQPNPKPSWLVPWDGLSEPDREVDRQIAEAVMAATPATGAGEWRERERCLGILDDCQVIIERGPDVKSVSAKQYAHEALSDVIDAIKDGNAPDYVRTNLSAPPSLPDTEDKP